MSLVQFHFESQYTPPKVIQAWWAAYGMSQGLKLPQPLEQKDASTQGGYVDNLWVNLELWRHPDTDTSICRLTAETDPFGKAAVIGILQNVAESLQPAPRRAAPASAFSSSSFTWIGGWDWTGDGPPEDWSMGKIDEIIARSPYGLCASDGTLMGDGTRNAKWGFVDASNKLVYLGFEYITRKDGAIELEVVEGTGSVPISTIPGVRVVRDANSAYSGTLSSDRRQIATVRYQAGSGYIDLIDTESGETRHLSHFARASGGEDLAFSPDDKWLLISTSNKALIIDTSTGAQKDFDQLIHASCWWVRDGHLGILSIGRGAYNGPDADPYTVMFHDLTSGADEEIVRITPPEIIRNATHPWIWKPEPGADGRVLVSIWIPEKDFGYTNLAMLDLSTGEVTPTVDLFVDPDHQVRRKQDKWKWNEPLANTISAPAVLLQSGFNPVDSSQRPEDDEEKYGAILRVEFGSPLLTTSM